MTTAEMAKPKETHIQFSPALYPKKGGNIKFPAPKKSENRANAVIKVCLLLFITGYLPVEYKEMILNYKNSSIYYKIQGNGDAIVLLHGFLESSVMWESLIPVLTKKYTVISIDLPGHGRSGCVSGIHTMELMAKVVHTIVVTNNFKSAMLVGHSMGGYVALAYTDIYQSEVDKLILLNSTPAADSVVRKKNRDRAIRVVLKNPSLFISMSVNSLFVENTHDLYALDIQKMKNEAFLFPTEGILAAILGMRDRSDRTSVLKNFSKEKIMVSGICDPIVAFTTSKALASLTNTQFIKVSGGHMSLIENLEEIVKILT
jgi:pimeloyl-ACP methyl ester carboxylesterase